MVAYTKLILSAIDLHYENKQIQKAQEAYEFLIKEYPDKWEAYYHLANLEIEKKKF